jgi:hypothetical protein
MSILTQCIAKPGFMRFYRSGIVRATIGLILCCSGCGENLATVEGNVTFNGQPVNRGVISLEPVDGKGPTAGGNVEDGEFLIEDVVPGEKIVRINAVYSKGMEKQDDGSEVEIVDDLLPKEWGQESKEKLIVEAPSTKKDFRIEGPDPQQKK